MDGPEQTQSATRQWTSLIAVCFRRRIRADQLTDAFTEQWSKAPVAGTTLASLIITSGARLSSGVDPLVPAYLNELLKVTSVDISDVMVALLSHSRYAMKVSPSDRFTFNSPYDLLLQESVFALLLRLFVNKERPKTAQESRRALRALAEWMIACNYHETMLQVQAEGLQTPDSSAITAMETVGAFAVSLLTNELTKKDLTNSWSQDLKDKLASAVNGFAALLTQWTSSPAAVRLNMIARTPPLTSKNPEFSMAEIASTVVDLPVSTSRIGLYVYLNAALCARPLTDDLALLNYLHSKYQDDAQSLVVDVVVASFDTLANALHCHQPAEHLLSYRSFIANKLPLLLVSLSASLYSPSSVQLCIQTALGRIDVHPIPPLSSDNDGVNEALMASRQDFLQACVMHQLGSETAFANVVGGPAVHFSSRGSRHNKESLASQCMANVHRVDQLVAELETMNGNAGPISGALTETLQHFCNTKETMSLRTLCNAMSRKLSLLDIILQYVQPADILSPLCKMLNEWTHDEDQSEFQPPYEEFASLLLLVLAVVHRYQLSESDIGLTSDGFVSQLLAHISDSIPTDALTYEQGKHLSKWMQGLYATDEHGETNGISDETMSHCPPQDFYLLVPTLFEQSICGCKANALALNTLKGGLEFLLEPFLLPSLLSGLSWLTKHSWEDHGDADILIHVLHKLLQPTSISADAQAMHQTIIAMIASPLETSLRELNRKVPNRQEIAVLIDILKPHLNSRRSSESNVNEITEWVSTPNGGLRRAVKDVISGLVTWSNQSAMNSVPTKYTHKMVLFALDTIGADEVLNLIVEEVRTQTQVGYGSSVLEVATALVCAPTPMPTTSLLSFDTGTAMDSTSHRRTLRQALRHKLEAPEDLLGLETEYVEALIRLGRRVDAQSTVSPINPISIPITNLDSQDLMQDISMTGTDMAGNSMGGMQQSSALDDATAAAAAAAASTFASLDQSLDLDASGNGANNDLNSVNTGGLDGLDNGTGDVGGHPNTMPISVDLSDHLFDPSQGLSFSMSNGDPSSQQQQQKQQGLSGARNGGVVQQQSNEDDIFAGLEDMDNIGDDDFNF